MTVQERIYHADGVEREFRVWEHRARVRARSGKPHVFKTGGIWVQRDNRRMKLLDRFSKAAVEAQA